MDNDQLQDWPPEDGKEFIRSDAFGTILVALTRQLGARYSDIDFTDAVAQVFVWFDYRVSENRRFINSKRFPSLSAFKAYLRQAVWNAARVTMRKRRQHERIEELPSEGPIVSGAMGAEERVALLDMVDALPEPHKTIVYKFFFDEQDLAMIASILNLTERRVIQLYEEAVDMLAKRRNR